MATIVDFCCKGPGLLLAVPAKHNRIAVIDDNDLRTKIIIQKKLPDVNVSNNNFIWMNDYTHEWTDKDLYEFFDLTEEEIKEIESEIK